MLDGANEILATSLAYTFQNDLYTSLQQTCLDKEFSFLSKWFRDIRFIDWSIVTLASWSLDAGQEKSDVLLRLVREQQQNAEGGSIAYLLNNGYYDENQSFVSDGQQLGSENVLVNYHLMAGPCIDSQRHGHLLQN